MAAALVALGARAAWAQEHPVVQVRIPSSSGPAGGQIVAPVQVTVPEQLEVGSLHLVLRSSGDIVTFYDVATRGLAEGLGITAKYEFKTNGDEGIVDLVIEAPEVGGAREAIPGGPLADIIYRVSPDAKPEMEVPLHVTANATGTRPGGAPLPVETGDTRLVVSQGYIPPCFFYMH